MTIRIKQKKDADGVEYTFCVSKDEIDKLKCATCDGTFLNHDEVVYICNTCGQIYHRKCIFDKYSSVEDICRHPYIPECEYFCGKIVKE